MDIGLVVTSGPCKLRNFPVEEFPCRIGRGSENPICLDKDSYVSSCHCQLDWDGENYWLKDLDSSNGTYINGSRIEKPTPIFLKKSTICIGKTHLLLVSGNQMAEGENKRAALENLISTDSILIPSSIVFQEQKKEESLFVIDICRSSLLATHYGENTLLKAVYVLCELLTKHSESNEVQFLKCTGDGFFVTFRETKDALRTACGLLQDLELTVRKKEIHPFSIRTAIHQGLVSANKTGDRLGVACHLVFRLQETKIEQRVYALEEGGELSTENRILLTDEAVYSLDESLSPCFSYVGDFKFKGFDYPVKVNLLTEDTKILLEKLR